jgi:hypothetical protein
MSQKKGAKGQVKNKDWQSDYRSYKPSWFEQQAKMINHEIPE